MNELEVLGGGLMLLTILPRVLQSYSSTDCHLHANYVMGNELR